MDIYQSSHFGLRLLWQSMLLLFVSTLAGLLVNQFRSNSLALPGDWSAQARMTLEPGSRIRISLEEAKTLFASGKGLFLDARPHSAYLEGHIKGAKSFPWNEFDAYFEPVTASVSESTPVIAYCEAETSDLSKELAEALREMGYPNVRVLVNGWDLWKSHGLPTARGGNHVE
jgi:rhodanese-related sulfurtransferase